MGDNIGNKGGIGARGGVRDMRKTRTRVVFINLWPMTKYYGITLFAFCLSYYGVRITLFNFHARLEI